MDQEMRIANLENDIAFLQAMVRALIECKPAHPIEDAPIYAAIQRFNEASGQPQEVRMAHNAAYQRFGFQGIHRRPKVG